MTVTDTPRATLTAREAADRARISIKTLNRYQAAGLITPAYTPGRHRRFTAEAVDALVHYRQQNPQDRSADTD